MSLVRKLAILGISVTSALFPLKRIESAEKFIRGDTNQDNKVNISDPVYTLNYLFLNGEEPSCQDAADINDDGKIDITDPINALNYLFQGESKPISPFPLKGYDLTKDTLNCKGKKDLEDVILIAQQDIPIVVDKGGTINSPKLYILTEDVKNTNPFSDTIIEIRADNVILDGQDHKIIYGGIGLKNKIGILAIKSNNIEIRNFVLGESATSSNENSAIVFDNVRTGKIEDNIINSGKSERGAGISLSTSSNSTISNNSIIIQGPFSKGIYLSSSFALRINNNIITSLGENASCISLSSSQSNTFRNNTLNSVRGGIGISLRKEINNEFYDSSINATNFSSIDILFEPDANGTTKFINTLFPNNNIFFQSQSGSLARYWYFDPIVKDENGSLKDAEIKIYNKDNKLIDYEKTNQEGKIRRQTLLAYEQNKSRRIEEQPYLVIVSKDNYISQKKLIELNNNVYLDFILKRK